MKTMNGIRSHGFGAAEESSMQDSGRLWTPLSNARPSGRAADLSQPVFSPAGQTLSVGDLLTAIPMLKGCPVAGVAQTTSSASGLLVTVNYNEPAGAVVTGDTIYDEITQPEDVDYAVSDAPWAFALSRLGLRVPLSRIDAAVTPSGFLGDPVRTRILSAYVRLLNSLDALIGQGSGAFKGLPDLVVPIEVSSFDLAAKLLMVEVKAHAFGAGEGIDCFIGNSDALNGLLELPQGQTGLSGWRTDARTGRLTYHFMGIPFYRCQVNPTPSGAVRLYGANLGTAGLRLIHAYGDAGSYGVEVETEALSTVSAARSYLVHGAWALAYWDSRALIECRVSST
ncbi:MAG: hypothetical protein JNK72_05585 [Myxococcales bacterium]|nr:hypothetical protein [Myxococcales bacterium]